jgi:hypothetical protein
MEVTQTELTKLNDLFASGLILEEEYNRRRQELSTTDEQKVPKNNNEGTKSTNTDVQPPAPIAQNNKVNNSLKLAKINRCNFRTILRQNIIILNFLSWGISLPNTDFLFEE